MAHHVGTPEISLAWSRVCNDLIHRVCTLYPDNFIGVCQLPQSAGKPPSDSITELERCVNELGFVGCNLSTDTSGGYWQDPPITDRWWYPFYEKLIELEVPAMIHPSSSANKNFHTTGAHFINGDTTAFMQLIQGDLFQDFPALKLTIPHAGGAVREGLRAQPHVVRRRLFPLGRGEDPPAPQVPLRPVELYLLRRRRGWAGGRGGGWGGGGAGTALGSQPGQHGLQPRRARGAHPMSTRRSAAP